MNLQYHSGEIILTLQVKAMKTFLPEDQHIERHDIYPCNIFTKWNIANTMHSDNGKVQPDHVVQIND